MASSNKWRANARVALEKLFPQWFSGERLGALKKVGVESVATKPAKQLSAEQRKKLDEGLVAAAESGHLEKVRELLENGADANAVDPGSSWSALHKAAARGHSSIVELLVSKGADVNDRTLENSTALHLAALSGNTEMADLLVSCGADVNAKRVNGLTPLHSAAERNHSSLVEFLVSKGADVNARSEDGSTALHKAVQKGSLSCVKLLVSNGADVHALNKNKQSALDVSSTKEIWEFLRKARDKQARSKRRGK